MACIFYEPLETAPPEALICTISNTLLTILIMPKPIIKDSATIATSLEDCSMADRMPDRMPDDAWNVNKGTSDGVDKTNASNAPPTTIPATNVANMAYL